MEQERIDKLVFLYMNTRALHNRSTEEECTEDEEWHMIQAEDSIMEKYLQSCSILGKRARDED
jgi:hypothetical protein